MATYRLRDRYHAEPDCTFEASDDVEALGLCRQLAKGSHYALRRGPRCIALISRGSPAAAVTVFG